jgi:hypothetical protein
LYANNWKNTKGKRNGKVIRDGSVLNMHRLEYHEAATPNITVVDPADDLKTTVLMQTTQIIRGDERTGIPVRKVNDIDDPGSFRPVSGSHDG